MDGAVLPIEAAQPAMVGTYNQPSKKYPPFL
jgi:hypothetical protein